MSVAAPHFHVYRTLTGRGRIDAVDGDLVVIHLRHALAHAGRGRHAGHLRRRASEPRRDRAPALRATT